MKSNSLTVPATGSRKRVQVSNPFSWTTVQKFYNAMPLEVTPCKNVYEAKMYTCVLLAFLSMMFLPLLIPAWYVYGSAKKGGSK